MRRIANLLTALLSLLVCVAPLSASICGLSCSLQSQHAGCHMMRSSESGQSESMVMSGAMNMPMHMVKDNEAPASGIYRTMHSMFPPSCLGEICRQAWNLPAPAPNHITVRVTPVLAMMAKSGFLPPNTSKPWGMQSRAPAAHFAVLLVTILRI